MMTRMLLFYSLFFCICACVYDSGDLQPLDTDELEDVGEPGIEDVVEPGVEDVGEPGVEDVVDEYPDAEPTEPGAPVEDVPPGDLSRYDEVGLERAGFTTAADSGRRYNEVRQKSAHNSFQRQEALLDQLIYHRVRSIEFDVHVGKGSSWPAVYRDWYVYHTTLDPGTTCHRLSDCLQELRSFHLMNPEHEVVTVLIDLKDGWTSGHQPADLDARITTHIPSSWILEPSDLTAACASSSTLQGSVTGSCDWPYLSSLQGKFIFVLTGGDVSSSSSKLNTYVSNGSTATSRTAFIAPDLTSSSQISAKNYVVFFNLNTDERSLAANVDSANFVSRIWTIDDSSTWSSARTYRAHHLATNKINYHQDTWAKTHNSKGWPFECFTACSSTLTESVRVLGVDVNSEDIWGSSDHFRFRYEYTTVNNNLWVASVSSPNSHVDDWAKGCLMARYSYSGDSPYFAMCRPADEHKLRIQWRSSYGGSTSKQDVDIVPSDTIDQESLSYIRLYVYNNNTCGAGYGSQDGSTWTLIGYKCFSYALNRQGIGTSSHGNDNVKFLYTNLSRSGVSYTLSSFPYAYSSGTLRSYSEFDGVFP